MVRHFAGAAPGRERSASGTEARSEEEQQTQSWPVTVTHYFPALAIPHRPTPHWRHNTHANPITRRNLRSRHEKACAKSKPTAYPTLLVESICFRRDTTTAN
jgi:hypothetical protein